MTDLPTVRSITVEAFGDDITPEAFLKEVENEKLKALEGGYRLRLELEPLDKRTAAANDLREPTAYRNVSASVVALFHEVVIHMPFGGSFIAKAQNGETGPAHAEAKPDLSHLYDVAQTLAQGEPVPPDKAALEDDIAAVIEEMQAENGRYYLAMLETLHAFGVRLIARREGNSLAAPPPAIKETHILKPDAEDRLLRVLIEAVTLLLRPLEKDPGIRGETAALLQIQIAELKEEIAAQAKANNA